jgi:hypothetical protein
MRKEKEEGRGILLEKIHGSLVTETFHGNFDVGLCADPITVPDPDLSGPDTRKPKFLFIG